MLSFPLYFFPDIISVQIMNLFFVYCIWCMSLTWRIVSISESVSLQRIHLTFLPIVSLFPFLFFFLYPLLFISSHHLISGRHCIQRWVTENWTIESWIWVYLCATLRRPGIGSTVAPLWQSPNGISAPREEATSADIHLLFISLNYVISSLVAARKVRKSSYIYYKF